jgi:homoserine dehydrogenase
MHYNLALIGFGNVARALARLLVRKQDCSNPNMTSPFRSQASPQAAWTRRKPKRT